MSERPKDVLESLFRKARNATELEILPPGPYTFLHYRYLSSAPGEPRLSVSGVKNALERTVATVNANRSLIRGALGELTGLSSRLDAVRLEQDRANDLRRTVDTQRHELDSLKSGADNQRAELNKLRREIEALRAQLQLLDQVEIRNEEATQDAEASISPTELATADSTEETPTEEATQDAEESIPPTELMTAGSTEETQESEASFDVEAWLDQLPTELSSLQKEARRVGRKIIPVKKILKALPDREVLTKGLETMHKPWVLGLRKENGVTWLTIVDGEIVEESIDETFPDAFKRQSMVFYRDNSGETQSMRGDKYYSCFGGCNEFHVSLSDLGRQIQAQVVMQTRLPDGDASDSEPESEAVRIYKQMNLDNSFWAQRSFKTLEPPKHPNRVYLGSQLDYDHRAQQKHYHDLRKKRLLLNPEAALSVGSETYSVYISSADDQRGSLRVLEVRVNI
jgi:Skp family chaperone for outer membrane proteins